MDELVSLNHIMGKDTPQMVVWRTDKDGRHYPEVTGEDPGTLTPQGQRTRWFHAARVAFAAIAAAGARSGSVDGLTVLPGATIFRCPTVPPYILAGFFRDTLKWHESSQGAPQGAPISRAREMLEVGGIQLSTDRRPLLVPDTETGGLKKSKAWDPFWGTVATHLPPVRLVVLDRMAVTTIPGLTDEEMMRIAAFHLPEASQQISNQEVTGQPGRLEPRGIIILDVATP